MTWIEQLLLTDIRDMTVLDIQTGVIEDGSPRRLNLLLRCNGNTAYSNVVDDVWSQFRWVIVMNTGGCMETGDGFWRKPANRTEQGAFLHGHLLIGEETIGTCLDGLDIPPHVNIILNGELIHESATRNGRSVAELREGLPDRELFGTDDGG